MSTKRGRIRSTLDKYFGDDLAAQISNRKAPNITYCAYTEFEDEDKGEYTYFIGEEVNAFENSDIEFRALTIPAGEYVKFTVGPGIMSGLCINAWKEIWQMSSKDLGGKRNFIADFEVYDERVRDPNLNIA